MWNLVAQEKIWGLDVAMYIFMFMNIFQNIKLNKSITQNNVREKKLQLQPVEGLYSL